MKIRVCSVAGTLMLVIGNRYLYLWRVVGTLVLVPTVIGLWFLFPPLWWMEVTLGGLLIRFVLGLVFLIALYYVVNPSTDTDTDQNQN